MPIDSTDDVEVVEPQTDAGSETGDQVDSTIEDVDPDLTKKEMALSNMMKEDDGGWDDAAGGGEGSEGSSFGDALQGGEGTTDNGEHPEENPSDSSLEGGDTSGESNQRERTYESYSPEEEGEDDSKLLSPEKDENALISEGREKAEADGQEQRFDQVTAKKIAEWHGHQAEEQRPRQNEG